jgi:hypothetical protein
VKLGHNRLAARSPDDTRLAAALRARLEATEA